MNKKTIFIILGIIAVIVALVIVGFTFFNKTKTPISEEDFINSMETKGYIITDVKGQFANVDEIDKAYIAISSDSSYQIEFYILADESSAISMFNRNKEIFEDSKSNVSGETSVTRKNSAKFTLNTNNMLKVVSRIDNTLIYLDVDKDKSDEIKTLLKELGY